MNTLPKDILEYILSFLNNPIVYFSSINDWGKLMGLTNEFIQQYILNSRLSMLNIKCLPSKNCNNSRGYDLILQYKNEYIRIQSKIRQVVGKYWYSRSIHFETTRRNSMKNTKKSYTGHVLYSTGEFDYVFISIIHLSKECNIYEKRSNINNWVFVLIPVEELVCPKNNTHLVPIIKPYILKKYKIKIDNL